MLKFVFRKVRVAQSVRALGSGFRGWRFESRWRRQKISIFEFFFAEKRYFIFELKNTVFRKKFPWQDSKLKKYRTGVLDFRYFFILKIGNYF